MDHGPIKVEWSLTSSNTNWRTENGDQRWGWTGASNFFWNIWPLSQNHT
jgi:hypothetical protein